MTAFFNNAYILIAAFSQLPCNNGTCKPAAYNNAIKHEYASFDIDTYIIPQFRLCCHQKELDKIDFKAKEVI